MSQSADERRWLHFSGMGDSSATIIVLLMHGQFERLRMRRFLNRPTLLLPPAVRNKRSILAENPRRQPGLRLQRSNKGKNINVPVVDRIGRKHADF